MSRTYGNIINVSPESLEEINDKQIPVIEITYERDNKPPKKHKLFGEDHELSNRYIGYRFILSERIDRIGQIPLEQVLRLMNPMNRNETRVTIFQKIIPNFINICLKV